MITLSDRWTESLLRLPEAGMGYQAVKVKLKNGKVFHDCIIVGNQLTTVEKEKAPDFTEDDIEEIYI